MPLVLCVSCANVSVNNAPIHRSPSGGFNTGFNTGFTLDLLFLEYVMQHGSDLRSTGIIYFAQGESQMTLKQLENEFIDASDEAERLMKTLNEPFIDEFHKVVELRELIKNHRDFFGTYPDSFFSFDDF